MKHVKAFFTHYYSLFVLSFFVLAVFSFFFIDKLVFNWSFHLLATYHQIFKFLSNAISPPLLLSVCMITFLAIRFFKINPILIRPLFEILTAQTFSVIITYLSKVLIGRTRPHLFHKEGIFGFYGFHFDHYYHSFPSGHTIAAFTLSTSLSLLYPSYRPLFYSIASLLSLCRVFMGSHYLSDMLGSSIIGITIAIMIHLTLKHIVDYRRE